MNTQPSITPVSKNFTASLNSFHGCCHSDPHPTDACFFLLALSNVFQQVFAANYPPRSSYVKAKSLHKLILRFSIPSINSCHCTAIHSSSIKFLHFFYPQFFFLRVSGSSLSISHIFASFSSTALSTTPTPPDHFNNLIHTQLNSQSPRLFSPFPKFVRLH